MNKGVSPINPATEVGQLRLLVGDTASTPLDPPEPGFANYAVWGDDALAVALAVADDNLLRAAGGLYRQLAAEYAQQGRSIRTDDLAIDTRGRGGDLLRVAQSFFDEADAADEAGGADFFQIVPFGGRHGRRRCVRPEATPYPNCCGRC